MEATIVLAAVLAVLAAGWMWLGALGSVIGYFHSLYRLGKLRLPGFRGNSLSGILLSMVILNKQKGLQNNIRPLQAILGMCTTVFNNAGIIRVHLGLLKPFVYLCKAEAIEVLLSSNKEVKKSREYDYMAVWLGNGLITGQPEVWRRHRKLLTPTFSFRILDGFQPIMNGHGGTLVDILKEGTSKDFVSVEIPVTMCALDIISETALGIKLGAQQDGNSDYVQSIFRTTALVTHRMLSPWLWTDLTYHLSPTGRELKKHLNIMNSFIKKLIAQRKAELEKEFLGMTHQDLEVAIPKKSRPFLDMMLLHNMSEPNNKLTDQEILDEVHTFTFTAHDTVSMATYWVMYYIGLYPEIQKKLHEEIDGVFQGDTKRIITLDDIKQLGYLERVVKESQRLTPAVPGIHRILLEDLNINGVVLPKGTTVGVFLMAVHRDPVVFPNPEVFDPDRFLDHKRHPCSFIPFSAGPRNCLGQKYAALCMKTLLANLIRNLSWTSLDPLDRVLFNPEFAIRPSIPLRLKFESRVQL